jgi:glycosyltransferase involved in cell wall biosynthesis
MRMNHDPLKISIVTCSYQHGAFIDATIRSVLEQGYEDVEYVVMDGGSTDRTVEILRSYGERIDHWESAPDGGQTDALIKGFACSRGEVMGWLCSDDLLLPNALETVAHFFRTQPTIDAVYGDALWIDRSGSLIRPKKEIGFSRFMLRFDHNYVPQPSMFWRRRLFDKVGGLDSRFNLAMDSDLWDRFSQVTRIAHVPAYLSCMRFYPEQKARALRPEALAEDGEIRSRSRWAASPFGSGLRLAARAQRCLTKLAVGGYRSAVPADVVSSLERYRIVSEG